MRIAYGEGCLVAILLPFVLFFLGLVNIAQTIFLVLALFGLWTIVSGFVLANYDERNYFVTSGIVLTCVSTLFVIQVTYAIALILIGLIASIFIYASTRGSTSK